MPTSAPETLCPTSPADWRAWLQTHHETHQSIWLIYHKKHTGVPSLTWSQAVDEALCFGWIDSQAKPIDADRYQQFFCRRKPTSAWSKVNKEKIIRLTAAGLMAPAGLARIETAKQNGSWSLLDEVEELIIPADLAAALHARPGASIFFASLSKFFASLSKTDKRNMLQWLVLAKRPETRQKRLAEIAELAGQRLKPKQFGGRKAAEPLS
jgi:uncharacterized protein YdeI (YjbR/CyaY-like superfamily)